MTHFRCFFALIAVFSLSGCAQMWGEPWKNAVDRQAAHLGYRNWIVIAEASFPAHSRQAVQQVTAPVEIPEALDYVMQSLEQTENLRPKIYVSRELRSVEDSFAPGIDDLRKRLKTSLRGRETTELDQQTLLTLLEDANRSYQVLVIRTRSALPYSSVFLELQPGYWDEDSEEHLRDQMKQENPSRNR